VQKTFCFFFDKKGRKIMGRKFDFGPLFSEIRPFRINLRQEIGQKKGSRHLAACFLLLKL
jgi:hypothetical protein